MKAPKAAWQISYENVDVTDELATMVTSVEYTDNVKGKSDEASLTVFDPDGRWRGGWFPSKGDRMVIRLGKEGGALASAGSFQVDSVELGGPPDVVTIRALAVPMSSDLRTKKSRSFEGVTLAEIAQRIARELELELIGEVRALHMGRISQSNETTLAFLKRLAESYGYTFTIRGTKLVFYEIASLEGAKPVVRLDRTDLTSYQFSSSTQNTWAACEVKYFDPSTKALRREIVYEAKVRQRVVLGGSNATDDPGGVPPLPSRTLRSGSKGDDVRRWQTFLTAGGHEPGPIDGVFGPRTRAATVAFQRATGIAADGVAGPETYRTALDNGWARGASSLGTRTEPAGAVLRKDIRAESSEHARAQAAALLAAANRLKVKGTIGFAGNERAVAGVTIELSGMGRVSGKYLVGLARHRGDRSSGYTTECEVTFV